MNQAFVKHYRIHCILLIRTIVALYQKNVKNLVSHTTIVSNVMSFARIHVSLEVITNVMMVDSIPCIVHALMEPIVKIVDTVFQRIAHLRVKRL